ncbi:hypothetical protein SASPL_131234 [Salvia splendens]|uniref:Uncharacterized protein n=1 Tax=Salvia splendens TaxID=180675 RepID=A0A8X8X9Q0_SALSN|nr:hypothetical protein SASPL_131234 [Salvia splendens]
MHLSGEFEIDRTPSVSASESSCDSQLSFDFDWPPVIDLSIQAKTLEWIVFGGGDDDDHHERVVEEQQHYRGVRRRPWGSMRRRYVTRSGGGRGCGWGRSRRRRRLGNEILN